MLAQPDLSCVILCGGKGTRLAPLTNVTPKPMVDINGKPHLERQIEYAKFNNIRHIILSVSYLHQEIVDYFGDGSKWGVTIEYVEDGGKLLGTWGALRKCIDKIQTSHAIVMNGDILTDINIKDLIFEQNKRNADIVISSIHMGDPSRYGVIKHDATNKISEFLEKGYMKPALINAGIYVIRKSIIEELKPDKFAMLETGLFPICVEKGTAYTLPQKCLQWIDIGTLESYRYSFYSAKKHKIETPIKFGTDGWRGVLGKDMTFSNVYRFATGFANYCKTVEKKDVVIGYDNRTYSKDFAELVFEILTTSGMRVWVSDEPTPTPALAAATNAYAFDFGLMITASHNPSHYNGIKVKWHDGGPATPEIMDDIEKFVNEVTEVVPHMVLPQVRNRIPMKEFYMEHLREQVDFERIGWEQPVFYPMGGLAEGWFPLEHTLLITNPDIREPIAKNLYDLQQMCASLETIGFATDGDGDRLAVVDEKGNVLTPQQTYGILLMASIFKSKDLFVNRSRAVKTVSCSNIIDNICDHYGLAVTTVPVGFKYIAPEMRKGYVVFAGEESGGFAFPSNIPDRDGILSALMILEYIGHHKPLYEMVQEMEEKFGRYVYKRIDIHGVEDFPLNEALDLIWSLDGVKHSSAKDGLKLIFENDSWLLIRRSGTEPLVRLYCESESEEFVDETLSTFESFFRKWVK